MDQPPCEWYNCSLQVAMFITGLIHTEDLVVNSRAPDLKRISTSLVNEYTDTRFYPPTMKQQNKHWSDTPFNPFFESHMASRHVAYYIDPIHVCTCCNISAETSLLRSQSWKILTDESMDHGNTMDPCRWITPLQRDSEFASLWIYIHAT